MKNNGVRFESLGLPDGESANHVLRTRGPEALRAIVAAAERAGIRETEEPKADVSPASGQVQKERGGRMLCIFGPRRYRADGLNRNRTEGTLKITLHAEFETKLFIAQPDLYDPKDRERFVRLCAAKLELPAEIIERDLDALLRDLRRAHDERLTEAESPTRETYEIPDVRRTRALEMLRRRDFFDIVLPEHARLLGLVGETDNFRLGWLVVASRFLARPLHGKVRSASASGKSTLLGALARITPPESLVSLSALSAQALYYMGDLAHRLILVEEDRGMEGALYPLKILQTEGRIRKGSVYSDPTTGRKAMVEAETTGPVASLVASTATRGDEESDNRYLILAMNESRAQTEAILEHQRWRETVDVAAMERLSDDTALLHQDLQRLITERPVLNPYALWLSFVVHRHRLRRDQPKLLKVIRMLTLVRAPLRSSFVKDGTRYLLSTIEDNATGLALALPALGRGLDEMSPHTRHFLEQFRALVRERASSERIDAHSVRVLRREIMKATGLAASTVHEHLGALYELDRVVFGRDERGRQTVALCETEDDVPALADPRTVAGSLEEWEALLKKQARGNPEWWTLAAPNLGGPAQ